MFLLTVLDGKDTPQSCRQISKSRQANVLAISHTQRSAQPTRADDSKHHTLSGWLVGSDHTTDRSALCISATQQRVFPEDRGVSSERFRPGNSKCTPRKTQYGRLPAVR